MNSTILSRIDANKDNVECRPVFASDFDFYYSRSPFQVRINLWGWPARLVYRIMKRRWEKLGIPADDVGEVHNIVMNIIREEAQLKDKKFVGVVAALQKRGLIAREPWLNTPETWKAVVKVWREHNPADATCAQTIGLLSQ